MSQMAAPGASDGRSSGRVMMTSKRKERSMRDDRIAVKLHPRLEKEGRGLCDPMEPRNREVIASSHYGPQGYLRVFPSGFILAQIAAGTLIRVKPEKSIGGKGPGATGGASKSRKARMKGEQR